jgi:tight adherence protein C
VTLASSAAALAGALAALAARDLAAAALSWSGNQSPGRLAARKMLAALAPRFGSLAILRHISPPRDLSARLAAAGQPGGLGPREWMALKTASALAASAASVGVLVGGASRLGVLTAIVGPLAGFAAPDFWLTRAARARSEAAVRELPDLLDLLRVSVEAGLAPVRAMGTVAAQFDGPLAIEWRRVAAAVTLGEPPAAAIGRMTDRISAEEVRAFADALLRARRHGLPLAATLAAQAASAREARRRRIREQAARAGPKMQLVVALVLVPSMLLIVTALMVSELRPTFGLTP